MTSEQKTTLLHKALEVMKGKFSNFSKSLNIISIVTGVNPACKIIYISCYVQQTGQKYIVCLLGGSPIGKASKKFGIPKVMLDGNKLEICQND